MEGIRRRLQRLRAPAHGAERRDFSEEERFPEREKPRQALLQGNARARSAAARDRSAGGRAEAARGEDGRARLLPRGAGGAAQRPAAQRRDRGLATAKARALGSARGEAALAY